MKHLTQKEALRYISEDMDEEIILEIDRHLSDCTQCVERVRALRAISNNFDEIWDSWTLETPAEANIKARVTEALTQAAEATDSPEIQSRVRQLLKNLSKKTDCALGIVLDTTRKSARVFQDGLEMLCRPEAFLRFSPVAIRTGRTRVLGDAEKSVIVLEATGPPLRQLTIDPSIRKITVRTNIQAKPWPSANLIPQSHGPAIIKLFYQPEGEDFLLADFEDFSADKNFLLLEGIELNEA